MQKGKKPPPKGKGKRKPLQKFVPFGKKPDGKDKGKPKLQSWRK
jgi:hypothetical protein